MSKQVRIRRDSTANLSSVIPAQGELFYDTTRKGGGQGDGTTVGGIRNPNSIELQKQSMIYAGGSGADTITITLTPAPTAYAAGMKVSWKQASNNTGAATINLNGLGAVALRKFPGSVALDSNDLRQDKIYEAVHDGTVFQLLNPPDVEVGSIIMWPTDTAPPSYFLCAGQAVSRTTYARLFAVIGTTFGVGDGSTTFNLPDFRGRFALGQDDMGGSAANRVAGADDIADAGGNQYLQNHVHSVSITTGTPNNNQSKQDGGGTAHTLSLDTHTHSVSGNTGNPTSATISQMNPFLTINFLIKF